MVKNLPANTGDTGDSGSVLGSGRSSRVEHGNPLHPVCLPGESHGWRSLADYRPQGGKESDTTELLHSGIRWGPTLFFSGEMTVITNIS